MKSILVIAFCLLALAAAEQAAFPSQTKRDLDNPPVVILPIMNTWIQRGLEIVVILLGLLIVFAGYRLFKLILFISGFILFYYLCYHILTSQFPAWAEFWTLLISAGAGLLGGFLLLGLGLAAFKIAAFIFGFLGGCQISYLILSTTPLASVIKNVAPNVQWQPWIILGIILGFGLILGILSAIVSRALLIIMTAFVGAFVIGTAADALFFQSAESAMLQSLITTGQLPTNVTPDWKTYMILSGVVIFAVAGIIVQFRSTAKNYHHRHGHHDNDEYRPLLINDNY